MAPSWPSAVIRLPELPGVTGWQRFLHLTPKPALFERGGYASYGRTSGNFIGTVCEAR
jgi:hypothetical protein